VSDFCGAIFGENANKNENGMLHALFAVHLGSVNRVSKSKLLKRIEVLCTCILWNVCEI